MIASPVVVITGSTRGIGFGLAREFLDRGAQVVVTGRSQDTVDKAVAELGGGDRLLAVACDVGDAAQVHDLWAAAVERFGRVDHWINNAGVMGPRVDFWTNDCTEFTSVVTTNLLGTMYGCKVAMAGMAGQTGGGMVWLFEGFGSDNRVAPGMAPYGSTKRAVRYLAKALTAEAKDSVPAVRVGVLSPGIVATDMTLSDIDPSTERGRKARKIYGILGDTVETVAPFLVDGVLKATKSGTRVAWLTPAKAAARFATVAFTKRDAFADRAG